MNHIKDQVVMMVNIYPPPPPMHPETLKILHSLSTSLLNQYDQSSENKYNTEPAEHRPKQGKKIKIVQ